MHELTIATELVRTVQEILQREGATEVVGISISIGTLSGIERHPLEFCFPIAAEGTPLSGAKLIIEEVPLTLRCSACRKDLLQEEPVALCPECGSSDVEIMAGRDLTIKSLEVR